MATDFVELAWLSPSAEDNLAEQHFTATRGEAVDIKFVGSGRSITGCAIVVYFSADQEAGVTSSITATVNSATQFTAAMTSTFSAGLIARSWRFLCFDTTNNEVLSFGTMHLQENPNLAGGGSISVVTTGVPTSRTLTIGSTTYDLSADRTWTLSQIGATTVGSSVFTSTNPSAITFLRANADNTVTWLSASAFRTAIGAGTGDLTKSGTYVDNQILRADGTAGAVQASGVTISDTGDIANVNNIDTVTIYTDSLYLHDTTDTYEVNVDAPTLTDDRTATLRDVSGYIAVIDGTLAVASGKTFTVSNTLTLTGTDGSTLNVGAGGTLGALATVTPGTGVAAFLTTPSSANLASAVTDETGTGALVFASAPALVSPTITQASTSTRGLTITSIASTSVNPFEHRRASDSAAINYVKAGADTWHMLLGANVGGTSTPATGRLRLEGGPPVLEFRDSNTSAMFYAFLNTDFYLRTDGATLLRFQDTSTTSGGVAIGSTGSIAGKLQVETGAAAVCVGVFKAATSQSANIFEARSSADAVLSTISENGYYTTRKVAAPADAELSASELAWWFDDTNGAAKAMFKGKTANGTVVTGSVTLS